MSACTCGLNPGGCDHPVTGPHAAVNHRYRPEMLLARRAPQRALCDSVHFTRCTTRELMTSGVETNAYVDQSGWRSYEVHNIYIYISR